MPQIEYITDENKVFNSLNRNHEERNMPTILQLNNSLFSDDGKSSSLANSFVEQLRIRQPDTRVIRRDLTRNPVPHLTAECFTAAITPPEKRTSAQVKAAALADTLVSELMETDMLVIGSPTYNFSITSSLKSWFDHVARAGTTFRYTEKGPVGLLSMKVYVFISSGGFYKGMDTDFQTQYIRHFLNFLGINDVEFTYLEGASMGDHALGKGMQLAQERIQLLVA